MAANSLKVNIDTSGLNNTVLTPDQIATIKAALQTAFNEYAAVIGGQGTINISLGATNSGTQSANTINQWVQYGTEQNGTKIMETAAQYVISNSGQQPPGIPLTTTTDATIVLNLSNLSSLSLGFVDNFGAYRSYATIPANQEPILTVLVHELGHVFGIASTGVANEQSIFDLFLKAAPLPSQPDPQPAPGAKTYLFVNPGTGASLLPAGDGIVVDSNGDHVLTGSTPDVMNEYLSLGQPPMTLSTIDKTILRQIDPPIYGEINIIAGATFELSNQAFAGQNIGFLTAAGVTTALKLDFPLTGSINDLAPGNTIDLAYLTSANLGAGSTNLQAVWLENSSNTGGSLSIIDPSQGGATLATLSLNGSYAASQFTLSNDGQSHPLISLAPLTTSLALADYATSSSVASLLIDDSSANVFANLNSLESAAPSILSIGLTDSTTPTLSITSNQYAADLQIIEDIASTFNLTITFTAPTEVISAPINSPLGSLSIVGDGTHDEITFASLSTNYSVVPNGSGGVTITGTNQAGGHVQNVEFLQFTDQTTFVENANNSNIARLYSAALDRAPDTGGLSGWEDFYTNQVSAAAKGQGVYVALAETPLQVNGLSIADGFIQSPEFQHTYGSLNNTQFVTQLYANVLERAPDSAGLAGWLSLMQTGDYTQGMVLVGFAESAENIAKDASWLVTV